MELVDYAKKELAYLINSEDIYDNTLANDVLELINVFSNQGHSGLSAYTCLRLFSRLAKFEPISPLTGEDDEWNEVGPNCFQNKRCSTVFKEGKDGKAYNTVAKIFSDDGETWFSTKDSKEFIEFPYDVPDHPKKLLNINT